jgi:signal transduction histidine kinase
LSQGVVDLVCVRGSEADLQGAARLLAGFGLTLGEALAALRGQTATAFGAIEAVTVPYGGIHLRMGGRAEAEWMLALARHLLDEARLGVLLPPRGSDVVYVESPLGDSGSTQYAARRALAARAARGDGPLTGADVSASALVEAGVTDVVGVPVPALAGSPGALAVFAEETGELGPDLANAAALFVSRLLGGEQRDDHTMDLEALQAAEARRMAGELHDGPVQQLTGAAMEAEVALKLLDRDPAEAAASMRRSRDEVRRVISQLRSLIFDLRSANVSELGLVDALRDYADEFARRAGLALDFRLSTETERLSAAVEQALFLIAREALINIEQHAQADAVRVALDFSDDAVILRVEDNGRGFVANEAQASGEGNDRHFGLVGIRERAERLNGSATIVSQPQVGTIVEVAIPRMESVG